MPDDAGAFGRFSRIDHRQATGSTNADALEWLGDPAASGLVIVADAQTAGTGQRGRRWIAPPGAGLLFTAILPKSIPARAAWAVPLWAGLAVAEALERVYRLRVTLQWPNDLLIDGRKFCGILCVSRIAGEHAWIGVGVGLNVHRPHHEPDLDAIVPPPIFLDDVTAFGAGDARPELLAAILAQMEAGLRFLGDPEGIARAWEERAGLPGVHYRFALDDGARFEGTAQRIAPGGALVVATPHGERAVEFGEARVVR